MSGWNVHKRTGQNTIQYYTNLTLRTTHGSTQTLHCKHHPVLCKLYTGDNVSFHTDLTLCMPQSYTADCTVLHTLCIVDPIIMTYKQSYWLMWCFSLHLLHFSGSYKSINVTKGKLLPLLLISNSPGICYPHFHCQKHMGLERFLPSKGPDTNSG